MRQLTRNLLWGLAGAAVAWLAMRATSDDVRLGAAAEARVEPPAGAPTSPRPARRSEPEPEPAVQPGPEVATTGPPADVDAAPAPPPPPGEPTSPNPTVVWFPPADLRAVPTDLPNRGPDDTKGRAPAIDLLDGTRVTCDFGAGTNTGMRFGNTLSVGGGAQWQGSLMVYDLLEPGAGKARLTGTLGSTGAPGGEAKVQLMTDRTRVYFMGLLDNGTYVITTIYDELDDMQRHVAVMSRQENGFFSYGTQWLGVCY